MDEKDLNTAVPQAEETPQASQPQPCEVPQAEKTPQASQPQPCEKEKHKNSQTLLLALNCVLLVGLIVLYILFFTTKGTGRHNPNAATPVVSADGLKIAYVDTDSLMAHYQYALDIQQQLQQFSESQQRSYQQQMTSFQNDYQKFLKEGPDMTYSQQQAKQKELEQRAAKLQNLEGELTLKIQERTLDESAKMTRAVYAFIREYNQDNQQFDLILAKSFSGSPVLYGNEGMDITNEIIEGLNDDYKKGKTIENQ